MTRKWDPLPGYRAASPAEKMAAALARLRDDPVECEACGTGVAPGDLPRHAQTCPGRAWAAPAGPGAGWIAWKALRALGVHYEALRRWLRDGLVRRRRQKSTGRWEYARVDILAILESQAEREDKRRRERFRAMAVTRWRYHWRNGR